MVSSFCWSLGGIPTEEVFIYNIACRKCMKIRHDWQQIYVYCRSQFLFPRSPFDLYVWLVSTCQAQIFFVGSCDVWLLTRYELEVGCTSIVAQDDHGRLIHGRRLPSHSKEEICASKLLGAGPTKSLNMVPNLQSTHRYPISISSYSTSADVSVCFTGFFAPTSRKIQII